MVRGVEKLGQDLTLWTLEPLGIGFTTPSFGSTLDAYNDRGEHNFIGRNITEQVVSEVQSEVDRILNLYQQNQMSNIKVAQIRGELALYQKSEVLNQILKLTAKVPAEQPDAIIVEVLIRTATGQDLTLVIENTEEGVRVRA
jgi:hypothetical protein